MNIHIILLISLLSLSFTKGGANCIFVAIIQTIYTMGKKLSILVISSQFNSEDEQQIISVAQSRGHNISQFNGEGTLFFIPDMDSTNNDKQSIRGTLVQMDNQAVNHAKSTGRKALANVLGNIDVLFNYIESIVTNQASKPTAETKPAAGTKPKDPTVSDGVDWDTLNSLEHMKQLKEVL